MHVAGVFASARLIDRGSEKDISRPSDAGVMRQVVIVVAALLIAGCAGGPPAEADPFDGVDVKVDETTGAIRGVVVDQSIMPVEGAKVSLVDTPHNTTTDADGRFVFSKLEPGFYLLTASKPLYEEMTFQTSVEAGNPKPATITVRLTRLFEGEPYMSSFYEEGYFTCSQAGGIVWGYSSSPCHSFAFPYVGGVDLCQDASACLAQKRDFHVDVEAGWQTQVFEMTWKPSAQGTSDRMGLVVSTYKPERPTNHWFANYESGSPMRFQLDVGEPGPRAQQGSGEHDRVPPEGLEQMSFFASVRRPGICAAVCVPGIAYEQSFDVYLHQFYYLPAPEGWSIVNGDPDPF